MKRIIFPIAILALVVGTALLFGKRSTAQTEISFSISPDSMRQIQALIHEKESRTPAQQKIDSQLLVASKMRRGLPIAEGVKELQVNVGADDNGMVDVVISGIIDEKLLNDLSKIGVAVKDSLPAYRSLSAHVPFNQLETIASLEQVRFIQPKQEYRLAQQKFSLFRPDRSGFPSGDRSHIPGRWPQIKDAIADIAGRPETPIQIGSASTEGDMAHRALSARGTFNVDGTGVKIGVLSDGINSLTAAQASGDLGPVTVLPGQAGDGDEGTAMLEIIHDIAPGAQLFFATGTSGIGSFAQNIRGLRAVGCDIIVDDIGYYVESPFQDGQNPNILSTRNGGIVTQAVNDVVGSGALFFSAAGNSGNRNDDTSSVWEGDFVNGGPLFPAPDGFPGGNVHDFDSTEQVAQFNAIRLGAGTPITLHWSDPIGASDNDYDIYVLNRFGGLVTASNNVQTGTQDPYEQIGSMGNSVNFRIVIVQKTGAAPRFLHLGNFDGQLTHNTGGEIHGHASASGSLGVAASPAVPTFPGSFSPSNEVEIFSSDGFRRIFFNPDGSSITPGNVSATGGILLQQPVFTAADGVSISGAGGFSNPFFGTSAAAPHAAAIAALISSGNPTLSPAQITNAMTSTAIDIEGPGVDPDSGHGIVMPYAALQSLGGPVNGKAFLEIGAVSQTETCCNGDGFLLPGESGTLNIILRNTGLLNASGIAASLSTSTPGITIQNASSLYPDTPSQQGATTNVTPFSISLNSTLPQDPRGRFTLTINYIGGHSPSQVWDFDVQFGFQPLAFNPGANSTVYALAVQPDGKVIVGGKFAGLAGLGGQVRNGIGRLNEDGTLDPTFDPGTFDNTFVTLPDIGRVYTIAIQANGKIIVGGQFTHLGGRGTIPRSRIGRLNSDGTIDASFNPGALAAYPAVVYALMIQPDGKILVGGEFTTLGGQSRSCIGRLNSDGTLDTSFNPGASNPVRSFALQQDGKIIVVGDFDTIGGGGTGTIPRRKIARLNNDGSVDASFDPGANNPIWSVSLQSDEKLLVSGSFSALGGGTGTTARNGMGRIKPDGTLDNAFAAPEAISAQAFALQADQKIILGGQFGSVDEMSTTPNYIARLHPLGSLDPEFTPGANNTVYALALQNDGMLVAGGDFTTLGRGGRGQDTRRRIGRLSNTSIAVQQLSINSANTAITWIRSGTSPEIYSATFESSQDGTNYSLLGNGLRTVGGWQLTGLTLESEDRFIRARGFYTTGLHNGSVSIVEFIKDRGPVRATVSGRLLTPNGLGLRNATVFLTNAEGIRRSATTSSFGVYSFENVPTGENYLVTASSKRYRFAPRNVQISTDLVNFDLFGLE